MNSLKDTFLNVCIRLSYPSLATVQQVHAREVLKLAECSQGICMWLNTNCPSHHLSVLFACLLHSVQNSHWDVVVGVARSCNATLLDYATRMNFCVVVQGLARLKSLCGTAVVSTLGRP